MNELTMKAEMHWEDIEKGNISECSYILQLLQTQPHISWTGLRRSEKLLCLASSGVDTVDAKADMPRKESTLEGKKKEEKSA